MGTEQLWRIGKSDGAALIVFRVRILSDQILRKMPSISNPNHRRKHERYSPDSASGGRLQDQRRCHLLGSRSIGRRSRLKGVRASSILPL